MPLDEIRKTIDAIDTQLLDLLSKRADAVHMVGEIKKKEDLEIYAPEREDALLKSLAPKNRFVQFTAKSCQPPLLLKTI